MSRTATNGPDGLCGRWRRPGLGATLVVVLAGLAGCGLPGPDRSGHPYAPPPPLAVVALLGSTPDEIATELQELESVVRASATPSETLVVRLPVTVPLAGTYVVRNGDMLESIARAHGVSLAALEAANPQLGPIAGRSWDRIYPGDQVTIPGARAPARVPIAERAPAGPHTPDLVPVPQRPRDATAYQLAQYRRALANAQATNDQRVKAWRAAAARDVAPWQGRVVGELMRVTGDPRIAALDGATAPDLAASASAAATTLAGLPGHRVLLVLGGERSRPVDIARVSAGLGGIHLVVANVGEPAAGEAWKGLATRERASSVDVLDPTLSQLQLSTLMSGLAA